MSATSAIEKSPLFGGVQAIVPEQTSKSKNETEAVDQGILTRIKAAAKRGAEFPEWVPGKLMRPFYDKIPD